MWWLAAGVITAAFLGSSAANRTSSGDKADFRPSTAHSPSGRKEFFEPIETTGLRDEVKRSIAV